MLDVSSGKPAAGVRVRLEFQEPHGWELWTDSATDGDGRCRDLLMLHALVPGCYRITFQTGGYFESQRISSLYPEVAVTFCVREPDYHHHIPLLLAPNSYTTYRGS